MNFKTSIVKIESNGELVRGYGLIDLIQKKSFVEVIYLLIKGELPSEVETQMLNALFVACIDHGVGAPSTTTARIAASTGNNLHTALSAGILTLGEFHGLTIEGAAKFFSRNIKEKNISLIIKEYKDKKIKIPGFGHKILNKDERACALFEVAKKNCFYQNYCAFAQDVEQELSKQTAKKLPLNIDGAMAAILLDMGFKAEQMGGFFVIGRIPGIITHINEQIESNEGVKRLALEEEEYVGEERRYF